MSSARARSRTGTDRVDAPGTSNVGSDASSSPGMPLALSAYDWARSAVFITCRRYVFSMRPSSASRASAPRSRITSTLSGTRSATATTSAALIATEDAAVDQHARPQHVAPDAVARRSGPSAPARSSSGSGPSACRPFPSRGRRRRCRPRSRCTRTAARRGCRCRSDTPARTACRRRSRRGSVRRASIPCCRRRAVRRAPGHT